MTGPQLRVLSAGAARGLVEQVRAEFEASTGGVVVATFGPVGAIGDAISSGDDADVVITSAPRMAEVRDRVLAGSPTPLGAVPTCLAVRAADAAPGSGSLATMLLGADALYCPDPARATAGIHLVSVLERLGISDAMRPRLRVFPHGAAAMQALAEAGEEAPLGCTQLTEILATGGVRPAARSHPRTGCPPSTARPCYETRRCRSWPDAWCRCSPTPGTPTCGAGPDSTRSADAGRLIRRVCRPARRATPAPAAAPTPPS